MYDWAEFRHFWYLLTVLEKRGFRLAAEHLHTSQPNLSVQARQFQEYASVTLFRKAKDGRIQPTEAGLAFISLARTVLETREDAIDALIAIDRGEPETLHLGCSSLADLEIFRLFRTMHKELVPSCTIRSSHGDTIQLVEDVLSGRLDAAIVTTPLKHCDLRVEDLRRDRLVVCLRRDHPLAERSAIHVSELHEKLVILYHPQRYPEAHARVLELAAQAGIAIEELSRASHPTEMQLLVREGNGVAFIREGMPLEEDLITRPILDADWTVGIAMIFHQQRHPKTIPILVRKLRKSLRAGDAVVLKKPPRSTRDLDAKRTRSESQLLFPLK